MDDDWHSRPLNFRISRLELVSNTIASYTTTVDIADERWNESAARNVVVVSALTTDVLARVSKRR